MKGKRPFWVRVKGFVRCRPTLMAVGALLISQGAVNRGAGWGDVAERVVQFVLGCVAFHIATDPRSRDI